VHEKHFYCGVTVLELFLDFLRYSSSAAKLLFNTSLFFLHVNHITVKHRWRTQTVDKSRFSMSRKS